MYLLAILLPPVAVLLCGKPIQALFNFFLLFLFWIPAVLHAIFVVHEAKANRRVKQQARLIAKYNQKYSEAR